jgi:predicted transcriptional regulator
MKVFEILSKKGVAMSLDEISIATGFKKGALSKYLKKLIEQGYIEKVGFGKYCVKNGRREEKAGLKEVITNNQTKRREFNVTKTTPCDEFKAAELSLMSLAA